MEFNEIEKASAWRLILATKASNVPALARRAAVRLYELGRKEYAVNFLIKQMNLYKLPNTNRNTISETCPEAAKELGRLGDERAIEPLFEALGELGFGPAAGLAKHGDPTIEERLALLAQDESKVAVFAAITLGYMQNDMIVHRLIQLLEHHKEYGKLINDRISRLRGELLLILGAYKDNRMAERGFRQNVTNNDIDWILSCYLHQDMYPSQRWLEWDIVNKYGWYKYVESDTERFVFRHTNLERWNQYSKLDCPFRSNTVVTKLREEIIHCILSSLSTEFGE